MKNIKVVVPAFTLMIAAATSLSPRMAFASDDASFSNGDRPANAAPGECWCQFTVPARYKTVSDQVMVEPARCSYENIPAVYEPRTERVCVSKESKRHFEIPAEYRNETYQAMVTSETCRSERIAAVYEDRDERVCVRKESQHRVTVPGVYTSENYQVCVSPARTEWKKADCGAHALKYCRRFDRRTRRMLVPRCHPRKI